MSDVLRCECEDVTRLWSSAPQMEEGVASMPCSFSGNVGGSTDRRVD